MSCFHKSLEELTKPGCKFSNHFHFQCGGKGPTHDFVRRCLQKHVGLISFIVVFEGLWNYHTFGLRDFELQEKQQLHDYFGDEGEVCTMKKVFDGRGVLTVYCHNHLVKHSMQIV
jgi:hypothetical protein